MQWPSLTRRVSRDDAMLDWRVTEILKSVQEGGDMALDQVIRFVEGFIPDNLKVTPEEFDLAEEQVPEDLKEAIRVAAQRIRAFHEKERPKDSEWDDGNGVICRRKFLPLRSWMKRTPFGALTLNATRYTEVVSRRIVSNTVSLISNPGSGITISL